MAAGHIEAPLHPARDIHRAGRKAITLSQLCTLRALPESVVEEIDPPLTALLRAAEGAVRATVAARLADCSWAPPDAVRLLAFEPIEISRPILERSEILSEDDLVALVEQGRAQRACIARRFTVRAPVSRAIARHREPECLKSLAANRGAMLADASAADFAGVARVDEALQEQLAGRSDLSPALARALYAVAGSAVRSALALAFPDLDPARIAAAVEDGVEAARAGGGDAAAERLAEHLMARSALTKADVLRASKSGRTDIADHAVSRLTGMPAPDWRRALARSPLRTTLIAARAMAMTQEEAAAFYAAAASSGRAHELAPETLARACADIYSGFARDDARKALHRMGAGGSIQ